MADNTDLQNNDNSQSSKELEDTTKTIETKDEDIVAKLVEERVAEALKPIKEKLNNAFKERDEARKKTAELEKEQRDANLKRLQDEGKHKEAAELQLAEERTARESAEQRIVELTRDLEVKSSLLNLEFRSDSAREMAQKEIVSQLVKDEKGNWVHKSGVSVKDFVKVFVDTQENAFLFKPKVSSGGGSSSTTRAPADDKQNKSVFQLSQAEVIKLAEKGQLRRRN